MQAKRFFRKNYSRNPIALFDMIIAVALSLALSIFENNRDEEGVP